MAMRPKGFSPGAPLGESVAKHGRGKKRYRRYLKGIIDEIQALGTLGAKVLLKNDVGDTVVDSAWCSSVRLNWALDNLTTGQGPILVGVAHSDYSGPEIEAWIENTNSWNQSDLISKEISQRKIRMVGMFPSLLVGETTVLNDGRPITTKCGWVISPGQTIALWYYNTSAAALSTSDPEVHTEGHANLWPM